MPAANSTIPPAEALTLRSLITPTEQGIASRVLARNGGGNITLFAFDAGQGLTEHTSPFEALVVTLDGSLTLTIGGTPVTASPGHDRSHARERSTCCRCAGGGPHAADHVARPQGGRGDSLHPLGSTARATASI